MKLQVYGTGCAKCDTLEKAAKEVVKELGISAEVEKVSDVNTIVDAGILATPGFAVDGVVKAMGRVPSKDEIKKWVLAKVGQ